MNLRIVIAVVLSTMLLTCHAYDKPKVRKYYDKNGQYTGKSVKQGNEIKNYDPQGKYKGKTVKQKNEAKRYDEQGKYRGKSVSESTK